MKLFGLLHNIVEGLGQGQVAPAPVVDSGIPRPARFDDSNRRAMLRDVAKVVVETWDTGPFATDICWLLTDAQDKILFVMPSGTVSDKTVLGKLIDTPGFNGAEIKRAMRSTRNARFVIWQRDLIATGSPKQRARPRDHACAK